MWACFRQLQRAGLQGLLDEWQRDPPPFVAVCRRFDETDMDLLLDVTSSRVFHKWLLQKLADDKALSPEDKEGIAAGLIQTPRVARIAILVQRTFLGWGFGRNAWRQVVTPPLALQNKTASNITAGLDASEDLLRVNTLLAKLSMFIPGLWLLYASDKARANTRFMKETIIKVQPYPNVFVVWCFCFAHQVGRIIDEWVKGGKQWLSTFYSLAKLLRDMGTIVAWKAGMSLAVPHALPDVACGADEVASRVARSEATTRRIAALTVFLEFAISAPIHVFAP
jgi:hypothetical protein